jgi:hypothetical protein
VEEREARRNGRRNGGRGEELKRGRKNARGIRE